MKNRYDSTTEQSGLSRTLMSLKMGYVRNDDYEYYAVLDKLTCKIDQLSSIARTKERDDKAEAILITKPGEE